MVRHSSPKLATAALALGAALGASLVGPTPAGAGTATVAPGDTLWGLASEYGTTVSALATLNDITNPNLILSGRTLLLPGVSNAVTVTVSLGQNLTTIAAEYGTTVPALAAANGIADPNLIEVGTQLVIPAGGASSPPRAPAAVTTGSGPAVPTPGGTLAGLLAEWSSAYGVPLNLLEALTWWESGWNNAEVSASGAIGLGQLEPYTVDYIRTYLVGDQSLDPNDPSDNLQMTAAYLHFLLQAMGGNESDALAAYYQGMASLAANGELSSTQQYVTGILNYAALFGSQ